MGLTVFYSRQNGSAAIGTLTPEKFTTTKEFGQGSFGNWTHVVARDSTLLFYNRANGVAAMGTLTTNGFTTNVKFEPGRFGTWTHLVGTNAGWLFYNRMTGAAAIGTLQTPWIAESFATTGSFAGLIEWSHIVADEDTVLFYNRLNGGAAIATVTPTSLTTNTTYQPGSFGAWTHVVNNGPTVLFYNRDTGAAAIGTLAPDSFTTNKWYDPGSFGRGWTHVTGDGARLLFYNSDTGAAALGTLAPDAFTSTTFYQPGGFSRYWTHLTGDSSSGPEDLEIKFAVLLCQWQRPPSWATVFSADYYRHYMFDLSAEHGIGRYWFDQSGGQLRFTGYVNDWIPLSKDPSDPSIHHNSVDDRRLLAEFAIAEAKSAGWSPGDERCIVVIVACPGALGVNGGAWLAPISVDGIDRYVAVLHADSANYIATGGQVLISNYRFDFNAHEVGHLVGELFSFDHAFGPKGAYDHPYCIMAAMSYGELGQSATYDTWFAGSNRPPEEHTKGPGLSGATRAACGWARVRRVGLADLQQRVELDLAQLGDHGSTLPQVIEYPTQVNGAPSTYTIEFRSRLAERDQALAPAIVMCQREGSQWSSNPTWAPRSSTFVARAVIPSSGTLPSLDLPGILHADVLEMAPPETIAGLSGPPWIRIRLSR